MDGAGDGDRTRDIQLGKLAATRRPTINQAPTAGLVGPRAALSALIAHNSAHNFQGSRGRVHFLRSTPPPQLSYRSGHEQRSQAA